MGVPRFIDPAWYGDDSRRAWRRQDPVVEPSRDRISFWWTFFELGKFRRTFENFVTEFGNASNRSSEIFEEAGVGIGLRHCPATGQEPPYFAVEFVFALGCGSRPEVFDRPSDAAFPGTDSNRQSGEIDNQIPVGRYNSEAIERLASEFQEFLRGKYHPDSPHEEAPGRQDYQRPRRTLRQQVFDG